MMKAVVVASSLAVVSSQKAGSQTQENHPKLSFKQCDSSGCQSQDSSVTIDSNWRWTHKNGDTKNCYTGNKWDSDLCPDAATCSQNCVIEGADSEYTSTYGVNTEGDSLSLQFVTQGPYSKNIGSRLYMLKPGADDKYMMFKLKNKEFTFTVDDSQVGCGLNGALYFVAMDEDGGASRYGNAGAKYGTGYCDAQCPHDLKWINNEANVEDWKPSETDENAGTGKYGTCCTEIDLWEANKISSAYTMHACATPNDEQYRCSGTDCGDNGADRFKGVCDKNGCDMQSFRLKDPNFYGPGSNFAVDSTKPITVTTQFITDDGTDNGKINEVKQFYTQNGKTIEHPMYTVNGHKHNTITDAYCEDWVAETQDGTNFEEKGGMGKVDTIFEKGGVLVLSFWDDHYANMLWLDSKYPVDADCDSTVGACRGTCSTSSGVPADLEKSVPDTKVKFSDIRYGPLGSTTGGVTPSPAPPSPSPSGGCPGGSLSACIDMCPASIFQTCVEDCQKRCATQTLV